MAIMSKDSDSFDVNMTEPANSHNSFVQPRSRTIPSNPNLNMLFAAFADYEASKHESLEKQISTLQCQFKNLESEFQDFKTKVNNAFEKMIEFVDNRVEKGNAHLQDQIDSLGKKFDHQIVENGSQDSWYSLDGESEADRSEREKSAERNQDQYFDF